MSAKTRLIQIAVIFILDAIGQNLNPIFAILIGVGLLLYYWHCFDFGGLTVKQAYLIISLIAAFVIFEIALRPFTPASSNQNQLTALTPFAMLAQTCILAPVAEELIFRYFAFIDDSSRKAKVLNWVIIPWTFALFHTRGLTSIMTFLPYLAISYILTYLRYKYQLSASYTAHVLNNTAALIAALLIH